MVLSVLAWANAAWPQEAADRLFEQGRAAQMAGKAAEAESAYRQYLEQFGPRAEVLANLGVLLARRESYGEAIGYYEQALKLDSSLAPLHLNLGLAYFKQGQFAPALRQFDLLLQSDPGNRQAAQLRAMALLETGRYAEAEQQYRALAPGDLSVTLGLATALLRQQKAADARAVLEPVLEGNDSAEAQFTLGQALMSDGRLDEALTAFQRAQQLNPTLPSLRFNIGTVYWQQRKTEQALAEWRAEYAAHPKSFAAAYALGAVLALNPADQRQAEELLRQALSLRPQNAQVNYQLAKLIWQARRDPEAAGLLNRATQTDAEFREAFILLGSVLQTLGRKTEAGRTLAQAQRISEKELSRQRDSFTEIEPAPRSSRPVKAASMTRAASEAAVCAACHAARVRAQSSTPHANSLSRYGGGHFDGRKLREQGGMTYDYSGSRVSLSRGSDSVNTAIAWAFGAGTQAVTPVIQRNGQWVEHRVSWYRDGNRLGLTPGHDPKPPADLEESLGVVQSVSNARRCFGCHQPNTEPGVHCQACHGDGAEHRKAPAKGNIRRDSSVALCAGCHRSPDATFASTAPELEDPRSTRFAPVGFQASRCFKSGGNFTCIDCHNPHGEPVKRSVTTVCQGCHGAAKSQCPRTAGCVSCHMKASSPIPGLRFTDHRIRVYPD